MKSNLQRIFFENINSRLRQEETESYKSGVFIEELEGDDPVVYARYKYIVNLCSKNPVIFDIPEEIDDLEKCCMMSSFGDYSLLDGDFFRHELLGTTNIKRGEQLLYVHIDKCEMNEYHTYIARGMRFNHVKVQPLTVREQSVLCCYLMKTYKETKCEVLRRLKAQAYLDRLSFPKNDTCFLIKRFVAFYDSLINFNSKEFDYKELEDVSRKSYYLEDNSFRIPVILHRDIELQLANVYKSVGLIDRSREIYAFYFEVDSEIECLLLLLGNKREAIEKIKTQLQKYEECLDFSKRVKSSEYCMRLAYISGDITFYDKAFDYHKSYEPLYNKGVHLFKMKEFSKSLDAFRQALKLASTNENILFSYACCLKEVNKIQEATNIFKRLVEMDNRKTEYHKNLAFCYFYLGDTKRCLSSLRKVIVDPACSELFFRLALVHNLKDEVLWCFSKLGDIESTKMKIELALKDNFLDKDELLEYLDKNSKLRSYKQELVK